MGVPKFFRWLSERYPLISEIVDSNRIPEFDNLYLDMNGIIHHCSHPNDDDPMFRITETQIFSSIFAYIDYIFLTIQPQKVFMLAVDGVAPRAKMNQQRARRFRSAMDAKENAEKALKKGTVLPTEAAFDSNCITPGTPFMMRLQKQLEYFISKKISQDSKWKSVKVILSGHDVPGEGEHKIMEYIRNVKSEKDYPSNTRHCLYGLDADLIMLGLLSHEPHFCLLREEVTFGRSQKGPKTHAQTFHLLHLSVMREYLGYEFEDLQTKIDFEYDFERILDDYVLMCYFVGNDFLPHLPGLHINEGGLALLFNIYKKILPDCGGYLNDNGKLDVAKCQAFFVELSELERQEFDNHSGDVSFMKSKQKKMPTPKNSFHLSDKQKLLFRDVKDFMETPRADGVCEFNWSLMPAKDRKFLLDLLDSLGLSKDLRTEDEGDTFLEVLWDDDDDEDDEESQIARLRVVKRYEQALDTAPVESKESEYDHQYSEWKKDYYKGKLEFTKDYNESVDEIAYKYVEGLQWVLLYYYHGVPSWEWFYPYHYAPRISDLKNIKDLEFNFAKGKPFRPFDQLMAVLPPLSKQHVPICLQDLMTDIHSPIIDFYPMTFELDMNGKKASWEAIVKIPFIDEKRLLKAIDTKIKGLTKEEVQRNQKGDQKEFKFLDNEKVYKSDLTEFPDFKCFCEQVKFEYKPRNNVRVNRLCDGARLGNLMASGFPSMGHLNHTWSLGHHGVQVFNQASQNDSIVLSLINEYSEMQAEDIAANLLSKTCFTGYPFLVESRVLQLSDELFTYNLIRGQVIATPHDDVSMRKFNQSATRAESHYSTRYGVVTGPIEMTAKVEVLKQLVLNNDGSLQKEFVLFEEYDVPVQLLVFGDLEDPRLKEIGVQSIDKEFPMNSIVFFLASKLYGVPGNVLGCTDDKLNISIERFVDEELNEETKVGTLVVGEEQSNPYEPAWKISKKIRMSAFTLSRITSNLIIDAGRKKLNIGLRLKFESKGLKVLGYSEKTDKGWEFSPKAIQLVREYQLKFPTVFECLEKKTKDYFTTEDLFPQNTESGMKSLLAWIKEMGVDSFTNVGLNAKSLTKESIQKIEDEIKNLNEKTLLAETELITIKAIPRKNVLKPGHSVYRLLNQTFHLGDRVISTVDFGKVPVRSKGIVVGIQGSKVEVLMDEQIVGGTSLDGRCTEGLGVICDSNTILNLTLIQPPFLDGQVRKNVKTEKFRDVPAVGNKWKTEKTWTPEERRQSRRDRGRNQYQDNRGQYQYSPRNNRNGGQDIRSPNRNSVGQTYESNGNQPQSNQNRSSSGQGYAQVQHSAQGNNRNNQSPGRKQRNDIPNIRQGSQEHSNENQRNPNRNSTGFQDIASNTTEELENSLKMILNLNQLQESYSRQESNDDVSVNLLNMLHQKAADLQNQGQGPKKGPGPHRGGRGRGH